VETEGDFSYSPGERMKNSGKEREISRFARNDRRNRGQQGGRGEEKRPSVSPPLSPLILTKEYCHFERSEAE